MSPPKQPVMSPLELVTVTQSLRLDCETAVSLFLKTAYVKEHAFILESAEHGKHSGRYSFIGWDPVLRVTYQPHAMTIDGETQVVLDTKNPIRALKSLLANIIMRDGETIPDTRGGMVGYIGYDAVRLMEDIGPDQSADTPMIDLMLPSQLIVLDHLNHIATLFCHQPVQDSEQAARARADRLMAETLHHIRVFSVASAAAPAKRFEPNLAAWQTNLDRGQYCEMVRQAKHHIVEGDIFQVVLSRAMARPFSGDTFEIYRVLRNVNPSPYMYYLKQGERAIIGGSPEALVTLQNGVLSTKPIAGTRPRGKDLAEDLAFEKDLLADNKEVAEHVMLVDLGRNDLGRVAATGSVHVPQFMEIERFSHVMHIVSIVQARLQQDCHALDALMSVFPAGTLSGAPKIRAMQIINELEPEGRGIYGGAISFLDLDGNLDSCIAIRTAIYQNGHVRVQAGAGIVADSVPDTEFDETTHKMMSMITAVDTAAALWQDR